LLPRVDKGWGWILMRTFTWSRFYSLVIIKLFSHKND